MKEDIITGISDFYQTNIIARIMQMWEHPLDLILFIIDIAIVVFLIYKILKLTKDSRAWQVLKGIVLLLVNLNWSIIPNMNNITSINVIIVKVSLSTFTTSLT